MGGETHQADLLGCGYALEQAAKARKAPQYRATLTAHEAQRTALVFSYQ